MPRVVSAGVPIRRPEACIGGRWSNGIALRLTVMPTSARRSSASLPFEAVHAEVDEHEVHVGAAGEHVEPALLQRLAERAGVRDRLALALAEQLARRRSAGTPPWRR